MRVSAFFSASFLLYLFPSSRTKKRSNGVIAGGRLNVPSPMDYTPCRQMNLSQ
jgi:hypothetical protein